MRFNASFLELALAYASGAWVFGEVCIFGGTWHNLPAVGLGFAGIMYCGARSLECVAAWISAKWRQSGGGDQVQKAEFSAWEQLDTPLPHSAHHRRMSFPPRRPANHADRPTFRQADSA